MYTWASKFYEVANCFLLYEFEYNANYIYIFINSSVSVVYLKHEALSSLEERFVKSCTKALIKIKFVSPYRPTRTYPADSKDFIGKKVFFLLVTTVHRITFYSISTETVAKKL